MVVGHYSWWLSACGSGLSFDAAAAAMTAADVHPSLQLS